MKKIILSMLLMVLLAGCTAVQKAGEEVSKAIETSQDSEKMGQLHYSGIVDGIKATGTAETKGDYVTQTTTKYVYDYPNDAMLETDEHVQEFLEIFKSELIKEGSHLKDMNDIDGVDIVLTADKKHYYMEMTMVFEKMDFQKFNEVNGQSSVEGFLANLNKKLPIKEFKEGMEAEGFHFAP